MFLLLAVPANDPRPENVRVAAEDIDQSRLILLEDGSMPARTKRWRFARTRREPARPVTAWQPCLAPAASTP